MKYKNVLFGIIAIILVLITVGIGIAPAPDIFCYQETATANTNGC
jgi:hypothetical protein